MVRSARESIAGVDACLLVVEAGKKTSPADLELIAKFKETQMPAVLAVNKIDLLPDKSLLMEQLAELSKLYEFAAIVPVSAVDGNGVRSDLLPELLKQCMPGGHFFESDTLTDQPERVLAGEIIREKLLRLLDKEIPHGTAVAVERMREREDGSGILDISAVIFCEKQNHKAIIIGKGGSMLKKIGSYAREDMERFFGVKINLQIWVKVKEDWKNRDAVLHSLGYDQTGFDA